MNIAADITKLIGHTPLVRLNRVIASGNNIIAAKLESFNPAGSVKERAAISMIEDAEKRGLLMPGGTIVEATSGNTGIALAFIAAVRGYKCIIVMPESMSLERQRILYAFGAQVVLTSAHEGMKGAVEKAEELQLKIKGSFLTKQFDNPVNTKAHELTTAEEIIKDTDGKVDVVIAGVGTGGTITGIGKRLKQNNPSVKIIAVEPSSSAVLSGGKPGPHCIQGIGAGFKPSILDMSVIDEVITVSDEEAYSWTRDIAKKEGLFVGISSGAATCGAARYLKKAKPNNSIVVIIFPDAGERYISISKLMDDKAHQNCR